VRSISRLIQSRTPRSIVRPRSLLASLMLFALGPVVACDDRGIEGRGTLVARVEASDVVLGSAVVEVEGPGIVGFEGTGDARVFAGEQADGSHRVVVVDPRGGDLRFRMRVEDVSAALPSSVVTSAADTTNVLVASGVSMTVALEE